MVFPLITSPRCLRVLRVSAVQTAVLCILHGAGLIAPVAVQAQETGASVDIGGMSMRYADSIDATAIALTPTFWTGSRLTSLVVSGTLSQFTSSGWSAQGAGAASAFTRRIGLLMGEIEGAAGGSTHNDGSRTGQALAMARAHLAQTTRGAWIGAGAGRTWDGVEWRNVRQAEVAAWARMASFTAFASASPVVVDDSIRYTDAQLSGSVNLARVELAASGGFRSGSRLPTLGGTAKSWGSASITGWFRPRLAIVASVGTYPVDLTQGFPGGRFASLSIRIGSRRFPASTASLSQLEDFPMSSRSVPPSFEMRSAGGSSRELRVRAASAQSVEVMGDFTDWQPLGLHLGGDGWWSITLPIAAGIHELNIRVDKGSWSVPEGMASKTDEFGGSVGILVVR